MSLYTVSCGVCATACVCVCARACACCACVPAHIDLLSHYSPNKRVPNTKYYIVFKPNNKIINFRNIFVIKIIIMEYFSAIVENLHTLFIRNTK